MTYLATTQSFHRDLTFVMGDDQDDNAQLTLGQICFQGYSFGDGKGGVPDRWESAARAVESHLAKGRKVDEQRLHELAEIYRAEKTCTIAGGLRAVLAEVGITIE